MSITFLLLLPAVVCAASTPLAIRELTPLLVNDDPAVRMDAATSLKSHGQSAMLDLKRVLRDGTPEQRRGAVMGLALLPYPELGADAFLLALESEDVTTRSLAAHGLALSGAGVASDLTSRLASRDSRVRDGAAYALALMGKPAVPALIDALDTEDVFVRSKAAWLLGRMRKDALSAAPALVRALECDDVRVMHVVAEALDLIGPESSVMVHHLLLIGARSDCPSARYGEASAPVLVNVLARPGAPLGQAAFRALAVVGADAEPALRGALASGTPGQQVGAALLLMDIDPGVVNALPDSIRSSLSGVKSQHQ